MENLINPKSELEQLQELNKTLRIMVAGTKARVNVEIAEGKINFDKAIQENKEVDALIDDIKDVLNGSKGLVIITEEE